MEVFSCGVKGFKVRIVRVCFSSWSKFLCTGRTTCM